MPQFYQVVVREDGKAFLRSLDGREKLEPETAAEIASKISATAEEPSYVYIGYQASTGRHKIGLSVEPPRRAKELDIEILHTIQCKAWGEHSARRLEKILHELYTLLGLHIEGEWFHLTDFDVWDLSEDDRSEEGHYHGFYLDTIKIIKTIIDGEALLNPYKIVWWYEYNFDVQTVAEKLLLNFRLRAAILKFKHLQEYTLARMTEDWLNHIMVTYIKEETRSRHNARERGVLNRRAR